MDKIQAITKTMDLTNRRRRDLHWLGRNAAIRNKNHPKFSELVDELRKKNIKVYG